MYPVDRDRKVKSRSQLDLRDLVLFAALIALIFAIIRIGSEFGGVYKSDLKIETDISLLPAYTGQTLLRMTFAYLLSLGFTLVYAYIAYRSRVAAMVLLPLLDILQSIPVLSFLPGVVLALVALFPGQRIGVEIASVVLIFTGMTWNMTFSFYQSLSSIPRELIEAANTYRLNAWQRFWTLELPSGIIGLVWNSVMSVAGGWFFLIAIESFTLGKKDFRLPGLGSFLGAAAAKGDFGAIAWGLIVLISVIIAIDFLIWQPAIAWAEKFKYETSGEKNPPESVVLDWIRRSPTLRAFDQQLFQPLRTALDQGMVWAFPPQIVTKSHKRSSVAMQWANWLFLSGFGLIVLWGTWEALMLLKVISLEDWGRVLTGALLTALRVITALILSLLWTVPVGVAIGRNPRLAKLLQPIVQIAASVPATALFPVLLLALAQIGGGLQIGSIMLMLLGTMWYVLFNVIAGAQSIPADLFEVAKVYKLNRIQRWRTVILPGIFPYLVTGIITAVGGAWNASIVSEYIEFQGKTISTPGLGATISQATATGNFPLLLAATAVMSLLVVMTNRLVWRPLYRIAHEKYQLLG
ncbi:ABC-type anion transport system, duplicated permease component [Synechococcus sp. PCC 7502]|uniref:ABC transporter permease n=1 Tax=Synechococcus sp. PCC 7502 TaxID=1173263 RepID=UPI00029FA35F|nr:ABC transporter permease subunit [Synechococcus sp. PCC 7502]AFY74198.1 ABC-type anion transport system, duplicated permease component [Synechococcus sp. PCC 7502]